MPRCPRLHVPGGIYYVVQRGNTHQPIFRAAEDYDLFERLLSSALRHTNACVHAYCWLPEAIHLALQIDAMPVGRVVQTFISPFARSRQRLAGASGHFFPHRYNPTLVDPDTYLLPLVRYVHHLAERVRCADSGHAETFSSHSTYAHSAFVPWLTTSTIMRLIAASAPSSTYDSFMACEPAAAHVQLFERCANTNVRVIGSEEFRSNLPRQHRAYRTRTTLDQIIASVASRLGLEREHILSSSHRRSYTLARALIAWHATERRVATLTDVGRRLRRDPSTLSTAIRRYRSRRPELFELTALHDVVPLGPVAFRSSEDACCASHSVA